MIFKSQFSRVDFYITNFVTFCAYVVQNKIFFVMVRWIYDTPLFILD